MQSLKTKILEIPLILSKNSGKIGLAGFEPTTSSSRTRRSTKLSHSPQMKGR